MADSEGVHRMLKDGTLWEVPVDGSLTSMSMPSLYIEDMYIGDMDIEDYYCVFSTDKGYKILHYVFDKTVSAVPQNQITLYSLKENPTIRQAVSLFQQQNPDVKANYVVAMGDEGGNLTDYIRALNTELLAGNGADIILLDGLPAKSYIEKGVLADISDIINPLIEDNTIFSNIANTYLVNGQFYYMPIRFSIPIIIGNGDALEASSSFTSLTDYTLDSGKPLFEASSLEAVLYDFLTLYGEDLIEENQLSDKAFQEFLSNLKTISEHITLKADEQIRAFTPTIDNLFEYYNMLALSSNEATTYLLQTNNYFDSLFMFALTKDSKYSYGSLNNTFLPKGLIGLNKASKNTEIAKDFIKFIFNEEVQATNLYDGYPINNNSFKKWIEEENPDIMASIGDQEGRQVNATWPEKTDRDALYNIVTKLNKPLEINQQINDILREQILSYLNGDIDMNEAINTVKSKVNTFLSE